MKTVIVLPLLILSCFISLLCAQSPLQQGWKHFSENQYDLARESFGKALEGPDRAYAYLGLSLVASADGSEEDSFSDYYRFVKAAEYPRLYVKGLWNLHRGKKTETQLEFLENLTNTPDGTLRAWALQAIGHHYESKGKFKKAEEYFSQVGSVKRWMILGEFENVSESGFHKDFGVLDHPEPDHTFTNKRGVQVEWFRLKQPRRDNWVDFQYHFYTDNSIIYAQNFCYSDKDQKVQFRLGVSGSVKVWVNDQLQFQKAEERNNGIDSYIFSVTLKEGHNRILLQVGSSEINQSNFLLRITDDQGMPLTKLRYVWDPQDYPRLSGKNTDNVLPDEVEAYFQEQLESQPDDLMVLTLLTQHYLRNDDTYQAKKILKKARSFYPDCGYLLFQLIQANWRDNNRTEASLYLEELKTKDPGNYLGLTLQFEEAMDIEDYNRAEELLNKIRQKGSSEEDAFSKQIQLYSARQEVESLVKETERAYEQYPDNYEFVLLKAYIEQKVNSNSSRATRILEKYLKDNYQKEAMTELASMYFSDGKVDKGVALYEELTQNHPIAIGYFSQLSSIYFSLREYRKAETCLNECSRIAPYVGTYYRSLSNTYKELGDEGNAITACRKAIYYNPYDYEARELLRNLEGKKDIFDNFESPDMYELYQRSPDAEDYPEDNSLILMEAVQKVVYENGGSEQRVILSIKVFNNTGVDRWKEYYVPVYDNQQGIIEKAEVLKANGAKVQAVNEGAYVSFPRLEPGDAILLIYRLKDYYGGKLSNHFWDKHYFRYFIPLLDSRYSLLVPGKKSFRYECHSCDLEPSVVDKDELGMKLYKWRKNQVPAYKYEPGMSNLEDVGQMLYLSSFQDWDYISEWYADLAKAKARTDFEVKETVASLFGEQETPDELETVHRIYEYIVNNIRYSSVPFIQSGLIPQKASRVISARQGDCKDVSTLFVAMCKERGINAELVLVNSRDEQGTPLPLPSIAFNHCIAKVEVGGEPYFVELTSENLPFGAGLTSLKKAFALEISDDPDRKENARLLEPANRVPNKTQRTTQVTFEGQQMEAVTVTTKKGIMAAGIRDVYEDEGKDTRFKIMSEAISGDYPNVQLKELAFLDGLTDNSPEVKYRYTYIVPEVFTIISNLYIFNLPWADPILSTPDFLSGEERKFPIELWYYFNAEDYEQTLEIEIPEGWKLSDQPEAVELSHSNAIYSLGYELKGRQLTIKRQFRILNDVVAPESYETFKTFMIDVVTADSRQLAFEKE